MTDPTHPEPETTSVPPLDHLNQIGVLKRREIEARIVGPLLVALGDAFGREAVLRVAREVIITIARRQGNTLAEEFQGRTLAHFDQSTHYWTHDNALEIEVIEQTDTHYGFNVTRCRYAEMYRALGIPELGALLSCNRDFALIEGFNPEVELTRTQTMMQGASHCDFRYALRSRPPDDTAVASAQDSREGDYADITSSPTTT